MAKITSFMLAATTQALPGEKGTITQQLVGLTNVLRPMYIPGTFSFAFSIGVRDVDLSKRNSIYMCIKSPSGEMAIDFGTAELPASDEKSSLPPEYSGFTLCIDVRNMNVLEEGGYKLIIEINGERLEDKEIPVFKGE